MDLNPILTITNALPKTYIEPTTQLNQLHQSYCSVLEPIRNIQDSISHLPISHLTQDIKTAKEIQGLLQHLSSLPLDNFPKKDLKKYTDGTSFFNEDVQITDEAIKGLSKFIKVPDKCKNDIEMRESSSTHISLKNFFITILFPLILAIASMLQTVYFENQNALESKNQNIQNEHLQKKHLQLAKEQLECEKQILIYLQQISETLNNLQENLQHLDGTDCTTHQTPSADQSTEKSVISDCEFSDVPCDSDTNELTD